jgi:hypothetical protein
VHLYEYKLYTRPVNRYLILRAPVHSHGTKVDSQAENGLAGMRYSLGTFRNFMIHTSQGEVYYSTVYTYTLY